MLADELIIAFRKAMTVSGPARHTEMRRLWQIRPKGKELQLLNDIFRMLAADGQPRDLQLALDWMYGVYPRNHALAKSHARSRISLLNGATQWAINANNTGCLRLLFEHGADNFEQVLDRAARLGHMACLELVGRFQPLRQRAFWLQVTMLAASETGHVDCLRWALTEARQSRDWMRDASWNAGDLMRTAIKNIQTTCAEAIRDMMPEIAFSFLDIYNNMLLRGAQAGHLDVMRIAERMGACDGNLALLCAAKSGRAKAASLALDLFAIEQYAKDAALAEAVLVGGGRTVALLIQRGAQQGDRFGEELLQGLIKAHTTETPGEISALDFEYRVCQHCAVRVTCPLNEKRTFRYLKSLAILLGRCRQESSLARMDAMLAAWRGGVAAMPTGFQSMHRVIRNIRRQDQGKLMVKLYRALHPLVPAVYVADELLSWLAPGPLTMFERVAMLERVKKSIDVVVAARK